MEFIYECDDVFPVDFCNRVIDKFEKRNDEWKILKRQGVHDWVRFEPATDKGWREGPGPAPGRGDRSDPAYKRD